MAVALTSPFARELVRRLALGLITLVAASVVVFLGLNALPGGAAEAALGQNRDPAVIAAFNKEFGLNRPLAERYLSWVSGILHGDLGRSMPSGDPVSTLIAGRVLNTAILALGTLLLLVPLSMLLGVLSAVKRGSWLDHLVAGTTLSLISMPEFVIGSVLVLAFAVGARLLPAVSLLDPAKSPLSQAQLLVLPVLTLVLAYLAQTTRMVRASMIETLHEGYVIAARLRGFSNTRILWLHALPNALGAAIQVIAVNAALLAGGVVLVETVFQYPGIGLALVNAVSLRDFPTVEDLAMLITATFICINLAADLAVLALNPRLRRRA